MNWKDIEYHTTCGEWHLIGYCGKTALMEDEELDMLLLQGSKDDTEDAQEPVEDAVASGIHCTRGACHNKTISELCGIQGSKMVPIGTPGSKVECKNLATCKGFSTGNVYSYSSKCRHKATPAYTLGDIVFHGGSESKVEDEAFNKDWLVISLLGPPRDKNVLWSRLPNVVKSLLPFVTKLAFSPDMSVDWRDYQAPPVESGFWDAVLELAKKQKVKNVLFYCMGGHGRTGTALAAMLVECCGLNPAEAVTYVRENYCKEAVESKSQKEYLKDLYDLNQESSEQEESEQEEVIPAEDAK